MSDVALKNSIVSGKNILFAILLWAHVCMGLYYLWGYMHWQSINFMVAVAGLPVIIYSSISQQKSYRFLFVALGVALSAFFLPVNATLFLALILSCAGLIETFYGKISVIPLLIILVISPISYIITIISFPVRIWVTEVAAVIMNMGLGTVVAAGNVITFNGMEYSVDNACMGLKMLTTSLWFSLYLLYFIQKKQKKTIRLPMIFLSLVIVLSLNVITNLIRIILLVYFNLPPESTLHELVGIGCFVIYTVLPVLYIFGKLVQYRGKPTTDKSVASQNTSKIFDMAMPVVVLSLIYISGTNIRTSVGTVPPQLIPTVNGYTCYRYSSDVIRVKNDQSLIYVKSIPSFYTAEHNPLMCWVGSGYEFRQLREKHHGDMTLYSGILVKNTDTLHTAWWYDNGKSRTINQMDWRFDMLKGSAAYSVVNVTCNTRVELEKELDKIFNEQTLTELLQYN